MRSALIVLLMILCANFVGLYIVYNLVPVPFSSTEYEPENSLIIDEGDELEAHWQYVTLNHTKIEKLANEMDIEIEMSTYNQNDIIDWELSILEQQYDESGHYYCEVLGDEYKQSGDYKHYISSHKYRIYEKPKLYLTSMFREDNYFTYRLIPIEVDDFIKSLNYYIYNDEAWLSIYSKNYTLETNSINSIIKLHKNNTNYKEIYSYNEEGILCDHRVSYKNQTAMQLKLLNFEIDELESQPPVTNRWFIISRILNLLIASTIIQIIIIIVLISSYKDSPKRPNSKTLKQKNSQHLKNDPRISSKSQVSNHSGNKSQKTISKLLPCSNCQTLLEQNANFCHNCGKQIGSEVDFCQFCGKRKLKDARYCIECGRPI